MNDKELHIEQARILKGTLTVLINYCYDFQKELKPKDFQTFIKLSSFLIREMNLSNNPITTNNDAR